MQGTIFKSGNSLAVRIPKRLAIGGAGAAISIEKRGDHLIIKPSKPSLEGIMDCFEAFDKDFMAQGRETGREPDRAW